MINNRTFIGAASCLAAFLCNYPTAYAANDAVFTEESSTELFETWGGQQIGDWVYNSAIHFSGITVPGWQDATLWGNIYPDQGFLDFADPLHPGAYLEIVGGYVFSDVPTAAVLAQGSALVYPGLIAPDYEPNSVTHTEIVVAGPPSDPEDAGYAPADITVQGDEVSYTEFLLLPVCACLVVLKRFISIGKGHGGVS